MMYLIVIAAVTAAACLLIKYTPDSVVQLFNTDIYLLSQID